MHVRLHPPVHLSANAMHVRLHPPVHISASMPTRGHALAHLQRPSPHTNTRAHTHMHTYTLRMRMQGPARSYS